MSLKVCICCCYENLFGGSVPANNAPRLHSVGQCCVRVMYWFMNMNLIALGSWWEYEYFLKKLIYFVKSLIVTLHIVLPTILKVWHSRWCALSCRFFQCNVVQCRTSLFSSLFQLEIWNYTRCVLRYHWSSSIYVLNNVSKSEPWKYQTCISILNSN